jgi:hypothetical protein
VDPNYTTPPTIHAGSEYVYDFRDQMGFGEIEASEVSYTDAYGNQVTGTETARSLAEISLERQAARDF